MDAMRLKQRHVLDAPLGVRGRNSDTTRIQAVLGWEPSSTLCATRVHDENKAASVPGGHGG